MTYDLREDFTEWCREMGGTPINTRNQKRGDGAGPFPFACDLPDGVNTLGVDYTDTVTMKKSGDINSPMVKFESEGKVYKPDEVVGDHYFIPAEGQEANGFVYSNY